MKIIEFIIENGVIKNKTHVNKIIKAIEEKKYIGVGCDYTSDKILKITILIDDKPIAKKVGILKQGYCFLGEINKKTALEIKMDIADGNVPQKIIKMLNGYLKSTNAKCKGEKEMIEKKEKTTMETQEQLVVEEKKQIQTIKKEVVQREVTPESIVEQVKDKKDSSGEELLRKKREQMLKSKEKALSKLVKTGCVMMDESTLIITGDLYGERKLFVRAIKSLKENQRKYIIAEMDNNGIEYGTEEKKAIFTASEIQKGVTRVDNWISGFDGIYDGKIADIKIIMQTIEKMRLLESMPILNVGEKTFEQIFEDLKKWFEYNLDNVYVGCCKIKNEYHVALVKRGAKSVDKILSEIFSEIAPQNNYMSFKRELYRRGLVFHDENISTDIQKSIGSKAKMFLGVANDKIISFNYDENFRKECYQTYCFMRDKEIDFEDILIEGMV